MSIGIVSDSEFESELNRLINPSNSDKSNSDKSNPSNKRLEGIIIDKPSRGRSVGDMNVPDCLRNIIGENAITEGNKETHTLSRALGISDSSVTAYKNGATSTDSYHQPNPELNNHITNTKLKIASKARSRLLSAIKHITDDKLEEAKPRDLAGIAKDMSMVIKNVEPEAPKINVNTGPTFVVYAPSFRKEEGYDVIVVNE